MTAFAVLATMLVFVAVFMVLALVGLRIVRGLELFDEVDQ